MKQGVLRKASPFIMYYVNKRTFLALSLRWYVNTYKNLPIGEVIVNSF